MMQTSETRDFLPQKGISAEQIEDLITELLEAATMEEKVAMMSGEGFFDSMGQSGVVWCRDLELRIGEVIGI